jgi:hypothetical protein
MFLLKFLPFLGHFELCVPRYIHSVHILVKCYLYFLLCKVVMQIDYESLTFMNF